jgi:hypothetical protein
MGYPALVQESSSGPLKYETQNMVVEDEAF